MARAVRFTEYGGRDVLHVDTIDIPTPGAGEIVVEVRAAGTNPGEAAIRQGFFDTENPKLPSGQGSDFAGVVQSIGDGVTTVSVGDEVLGWSFSRSSQASHVLVPADQVVEKPASISWEAAGSLYVVGVTAYAAVRAIAPSEGETVAVSAAAGGVGSVVVQMLRHKGVNVLGIASASNADWLTLHGVTPILYGDGLEDRLRAAAPDGIDAFIDLFGPDYLDLAVALGVPVDRIETIISFEKAQQLGTKAEGSVDATTTDILAEVAGLVADGTIEIPIAATFPLEDVQDAYSQLEDRHTHGKIVLLP
jgi:NADPH:quinone reductase-like Zn-dependent oxidoreductase